VSRGDIDHPKIWSQASREQEFLRKSSLHRPNLSTTWGHHVLIPFAMEHIGRLGAHAHAPLLELARKAVQSGRHNRALRLDSAGDLVNGEMLPHMSSSESNDGRGGSHHGSISRSLGSYSASIALTRQMAATSSRLLDGV